MAFSLSGSTITQTGTDANLSGLAGIAGVTVNTLASASGTFQGVTQYVINASTTLVVNGTISHDPDSEILVLQRNSTDRPLTINGTYNFGSSAVFRGGTVYQAGCGLVIAGYYTGTQRQFQDAIAGIYISATGTLNWKGAAIFSGRSIISDGALNIEDAKFVPRCTNTATKDYCPRVGFKSGTGALNGLVVEGESGHFFGVTLGSMTLSQFQRLDVVGNNDAAAIISPEPASGFGSPFLFVSDIKDLSTGNLYVSRAWQQRFIEIMNYGGGVNLKDQLSDKTSTDFNAKGAVLVTKQVSAKFLAQNGAPIQDAKFYISEVSDGNEPPSSVSATFTAQDISFLESPRSFLLTSDANGDTVTAKLAIYFGYKMLTAAMVDNVRTKNGGNTLDAAWISYAHGIGGREVDVSGQSAGLEQLTLVRDVSITQTDRIAVDAYTTLETSAKLYDRAKSWMVENYTGQAATLVSRSGTLINAGSYNVTIDATAAQAFAVVGSTITIKASTYTGDMTTAGLITLVNGAQFVGTRTDATGTVAPPVLQSVTVSNGVAGTLLLIQDVTAPASPVTLYRGTPATWPHTWTDSADYAADRDIRVRAAYQSGTTAKLFVDELIGTSTYAAPALGYRLNQQDDATYNTRAQDGSTVSGITINDTALLIEVTTGSIEWGALYAYEVHWLATSAGIVDEGRIITALDTANYVFEGAWKIKNVSSPVAPLVISGGWGRSVFDNTTQSLIDTTGGPIFTAPDQVYTTIVSTASPVITGDISQVPTAAQNAAAVLAAAATTPIQADVKRVNGVVVDGVGSEENPWGPGA